MVDNYAKQNEIRPRTLCASLFVPLAVGVVSAIITNDGMDAYKRLEKPPLSPPEWVFPVVWTVLFVLMGIASYLVAVSDAGRSRKKTALTLYGIQLAFNFIWTVLYFGMKLYLPAFIWLVALWVLIVATIMSFSAVSRCAARLMLPYLIWTTFAAYLNFGIYLINK